MVWIIVGVIALGALGLACNWVLRARGGLDSMYQVDPERAARTELDAQLHVMQTRNRDSGSSYGGF